MSDAHIIEVEFSSQGETLILRDLNRSPCDPSGANLDGTRIKSGDSAELRTGKESAAQQSGSLSLYAGQEKVGVLNWDHSELTGDLPVDWTPSSSNYQTSVCAGQESASGSGLIRLRISKSQTERPRSNKLGPSVGHLGFAGL